MAGYGLQYGEDGRLMRRSMGGGGNGNVSGLTQPEASAMVGLAQVAAHEDQNARADGAIRGSGLLTKYQPVGGWQEGTGSGGGGTGAPGGKLAQASSEFGEPTSYAGGQGAPAPITVMKGSRLSYVNASPDNSEGGFTPTPGTGSREFSTPLQAGQAYNQANDTGEFNAPGTALAQAQSGLREDEARTKAALDARRPDLKEAAAKSEAERAGQDLLGKATSLYGIPETKLDKATGQMVETGRQVLHPEVSKLLMGNMPQGMGDVSSTLDRLKPEIDTIHTVDKFNNPKTAPDTRSQVLDNYKQQMTAAGHPVNSDWAQYILSAPVTKDNLSFFQKFQSAPAPQQNAGPAPAPAAPATPGSRLSAIQQAPQLTPDEEAAQAAGSFGPQETQTPSAMGGFATGKDQRTLEDRQRDQEEGYQNRLM